jgi:hypothetical protein
MFNAFCGSCVSTKIDLAARKSRCESNDPEFAAKAADVVGLHKSYRRASCGSATQAAPASSIITRRGWDAGEERAE